MAEGFGASSEILCRQPKRNATYFKPVGQLYENQHDLRWQRIISVWNESTNKLVNTKVTKILFHGVRPTFRVVLNNGWELTGTPGQQILTKDGWKPIVQLICGELIGCSRKRNIWWSAVKSVEDTGVDMVYTLECAQAQGHCLVGGIVAY